MDIPPHASKPRIRPRDVVAYAEYFAGFTEKLTKWTLVIAADGRLVQHVRQFMPHLPRSDWERSFEAILEAKQLEAINEEAASAAFEELASKYASNADDQERMTLTLKGKSVETYGSWWILTYHEPPLVEVKRFLRVWNAVHRHAPFLEEHPPITDDSSL